MEGKRMKYNVEFDSGYFIATTIAADEKELNDIKRHFNRKGFKILNVKEVE